MFAWGTLLILQLESEEAVPATWMRSLSLGAVGGDPAESDALKSTLKAITDRAFGRSRGRSRGKILAFPREVWETNHLRVKWRGEINFHAVVGKFQYHLWATKVQKAIVANSSVVG